MPLSRGGLTLAALLAGGALLSGCGGSSHGSSGNTHSAPQTATTAPAGPQISVSQARGLAQRVNLRASDLPGFHGERESARERAESQIEKRLKHEMLVCAGAQRLPAHGLLGVNSLKFTRERAGSRETAQSQVSLAPTAAEAREELATISGPRGARCVSRYVSQLLRLQRPAGASFGPVHVAHGTPPAPGADGSFALRVTVPLKVGATQLPLYIDLLGFVRGPVEVSLNTAGIPASFSAPIEERLFTLLAERARQPGT